MPTSRPLTSTALTTTLAAALSLGGLVGYHMAANPEPAAAQGCERAGYRRGGSCRGAERDATGCCPPAARPTKARRGRRGGGQRQRHGWGGVPECDGALQSNEDTAGHCCWPGQYWLATPGSCQGTPQCPPFQTAQDDGDCACAPGRVQNANTRGNCCWPGQGWVPSRSACVGEPRCGAGFVRAGDGCETQEVAEVRQGEMARLQPHARPTEVVVSGGTFAMGVGTYPPVRRQVTISSFFIDRTEVTVEAYGLCAAAGGCAPVGGHSEECNTRLDGHEQHPVDCVDWEQARAYCEWAGGRLPTEAEWEYAAVGTDGRRYPWGGAPPAGQLHWSGACGALSCAGGTAPVGTYPGDTSPFGVRDMAGNVSEWTADWFAAYTSGDLRDPTGPSSGERRVYRSNSWQQAEPIGVLATYRQNTLPALPTQGRGFRCARGADAASLGRERERLEALERERGRAERELARLREQARPGELLVPAGTFWMGGLGGAEHRVTLSAYFIGRTEVTVEAYARCVAAGRCAAADTRDGCNAGRRSRGQHPINCVGWRQARLFCRWAGGRLPTEAEWEYAALGSDGRRYPWGNRAPSDTLLRWSGGCGEGGCIGGTEPVGRHAAGASPFGALDMAGNVLEWTGDIFASLPHHDHVRDPVGPSRGRVLVLRGGSWRDHVPSFVTGLRREGLGAQGGNGTGFRCARGT